MSPPAAAEGTAVVDCAHCGLPVPGGDPAVEAPQFCCNGCRAVYDMLRGAGLGDFYTLRARMGEAPAGIAADRPTEVYARYDDPAFAERFVRDAGAAREVELHVDGVHCTACVWVMDQLPRVVPGVEQARLDFGRQRLWLRWDPARVELSNVAGFLHGIGYASRPLGAEADAARRRADRGELIRMAAMLAVAGNVMLLSFALYAGAFSGMEPRFVRFFEWLSLILALPAITWGALPFYRGAWAGLKLRVAHIDLPIALGVLASFTASAINTVRGSGEVYFDSVTALVALLLVGRFIQNRGQRAAMNRAELLSALTPDVVRRREGADWVRVGIDDVVEGDVLRVEADETLPADGVVQRGGGHVDQRLLTGESRPVAARPGDRVYAGTACVGGHLELRVEAAGAGSRLGRLIELIDRADGQRAPIVRTADRLSGWFVAAVLALAAAGGVGWAIVDPTRAFDVVVALLVVSCPCALGMATPVALAVARKRAADAGIVMSSTAAVERLAGIERVWFDKTGTLTEGRMAVAGAWVPHALRAAVGALERRSSHPIGRAIAAWAAEGASDAEIEAVALTEVEEIAGRGIQARLGDGRRLFVGAVGDAAGPFEPQLRAALARGQSPVAVRIDGRLVGALALGDRLRPGAREAIDALRAEGVAVGVLSGDHPAVARAVGEALGIGDARGGQSPEAKAAVLAETGGAMVGDGFNDAPALRAADVGLAVHGGAEVALQVADVYLSRPDPAAVAAALVGARRAMTVVRRGLGVSLVYNAVFAHLALMGLISPLVAAILMPLSSISVIAHAVAAPSFRRTSARWVGPCLRNVTIGMIGP